MSKPYFWSFQTRSSATAVWRRHTRIRHTIAHLVGILALCSLNKPVNAVPNFIIVLIDDLGYGDLSSYGSKYVSTDNLDRLAREGLRFTQFYSGAPMCSASRVAITTGQYPVRWGITSFLGTRKKNARRGMPQWLDPKAPSVARILQQKGYLTGHFGKWHMGGGRDVGEAPFIKEYGFDRSVTQMEGLGDRVLSFCEQMAASRGASPKSRNAKKGVGVLEKQSEKLGRGVITWVDASRRTSVLVDHALAFIKDAQANGKPFFINLWTEDVHYPYCPPRDLRGDGGRKALYYGTVKALDTQLAPLFDYIRSNERLNNNTIVFVTSDNGPKPGVGSSGSFRGHKGTLYEGGIREPFIVWAPGLIAANRKGFVDDRTTLAAIDLAPSIVNMAGASAGANMKPDGVDMSAVLMGQRSEVRSQPLVWVRPAGLGGPEYAIRDGDWKLLLFEGASRFELYNLTADPSERNNVAAQHTNLVRKLRARLEGERKTFPAGGAVGRVREVGDADEEDD